MLSVNIFNILQSIIKNIKNKTSLKIVEFQYRDFDDVTLVASIEEELTELF